MAFRCHSGLKKLEPLLLPACSFTLSSGGRRFVFWCFSISSPSPSQSLPSFLLVDKVVFFVFFLPLRHINNSHFYSHGLSFSGLHLSLSCLSIFCVFCILQLPLENVEVILLTLLRWKKEKKKMSIWKQMVQMDFFLFSRLPPFRNRLAAIFFPVRDLGEHSLLMGPVKWKSFFVLLLEAIQAQRVVFLLFFLINISFSTSTPPPHFRLSHSAERRAVLRAGLCSWNREGAAHVWGAAQWQRLGWSGHQPQRKQVPGDGGGPGDLHQVHYPRRGCVQGDQTFWVTAKWAKMNTERCVHVWMWSKRTDVCASTTSWLR